MPLLRHPMIALCAGTPAQPAQPESAIHPRPSRRHTGMPADREAGRCPGESPTNQPGRPIGFGLRVGPGSASWVGCPRCPGPPIPAGATALLWSFGRRSPDASPARRGRQGEPAAEHREGRQPGRYHRCARRSEPTGTAAAAGCARTGAGPTAGWGSAFGWDMFFVEQSYQCAPRTAAATTDGTIRSIRCRCANPIRWFRPRTD